MKNEIWKDVVGYEGKYQVSNLGRVKSLPKYTYSKGYPQLRKERILKPGNTGKYRNYPTVHFSDGKGYKVHRLVAMAFIPNPNNLPMINHKDKNTFNNCVDNLEWCSNQYNVKYSAKPLSAEHKRKLSVAHLGKPLSEEHKNSIKKSLIEYYKNEEHRKKLSERTKQWWKNRKETV